MAASPHIHLTHHHIKHCPWILGLENEREEKNWLYSMIAGTGSTKCHLKIPGALAPGNQASLWCVRTGWAEMGNGSQAGDRGKSKKEQADMNGLLATGVQGDILVWAIEGQVLVQSHKEARKVCVLLVALVTT